MNASIAAGLRYFLKFILVYIGLTSISLIPDVGAFFNKLYRQPTEKALQMTFPKAYIKLYQGKDQAGVIRFEYTSKEQIRASRQAQRQGQKAGAQQVRGKVHNVKFYNLFLSFFIFFVALMLSSPLNWKELLIGILTGGFLFYLYTLFKISLTLFVYFNEPELSIYQTRPFLLNLSQQMLYFMTLGTSVLIVLILWAAIVFKKNNWKTFLKA